MVEHITRIRFWQSHNWENGIFSAFPYLPPPLFFFRKNLNVHCRGSCLPCLSVAGSLELKWLGRGNLEGNLRWLGRGGLHNSTQVGLFLTRLLRRVGGGTDIAIDILQCSVSLLPCVRRRTWRYLNSNLFEFVLNSGRCCVVVRVNLSLAFL